MEYGLIGKKLSYSHSPYIHSLLGNYNYELVELDDISQFMAEKNFKGINVTMPYKIEAVRYCDEVSNVAKKIGCVNTVIKRDDGTLYGDNTDYYGFVFMLNRANLNPKGKQVLLFGNGGAAKMAKVALENMGAKEVVTVSRQGEVNYENVYLHEFANMIVNTTPVGMYPNNGDTLINLYRFPMLCAVVDVVYNPAKTKLILDAEKNYIHFTGGLPMLVAQAVKSADLFLGKQSDDEYCEQIYKKVAFDIKNILLIGMPGCGKTSIGRVLAQKLNRQLIDLDEEITKKTGKSPEKIIKTDGEKVFRSIETEVLKEISKLSGKIISCGGGVISPKENRFIMKQNSNVVWIQRDINQLATEGRPLSEIIGTHELYRYREPLYIESSDYNVINNGTIEQAADKIIKVIQNEAFSS